MPRFFASEVSQISGSVKTCRGDRTGGVKSGKTENSKIAEKYGRFKAIVAYLDRGNIIFDDNRSALHSADKKPGAAEKVCVFDVSFAGRKQGK